MAKFLAVAPDGAYAYGVSSVDAQQQLMNLGGDTNLATHYQVSDTHQSGRVNTLVDVKIVTPRKR